MLITDLFQIEDIKKSPETIEANISEWPKARINQIWAKVFDERRAERIRSK